MACKVIGLGGYFPYLIIIGNKKHKSFVSKSNFVKRYCFVDELKDLPSFLMELPFEERIPVVVSGDSIAEKLDSNYDLLSPKYILNNCYDKQGGICYWMVKNNMLEEAVKCGFSVPQTIVLDLNEDVDFKKIQYPCILKPIESAKLSKVFFRICNNEAELSESIKSLKGQCDLMLLQNYINKEYEYLVYGVSTNEEIVIPGGLIKINTCTSPHNMGMTSFACLSSEIPKQLRNFDLIRSFIKSIGYHGLFSMEFLITKDKAYFLEINLRNDGTCYITTQAGVNIPTIWAASCYNDDNSYLKRQYIRPRTYGMNGINYLHYTLIEVGLYRSIMNLKRTNTFSIILKGDVKPIIYKFIYHYGNKLFDTFR